MDFDKIAKMSQKAFDQLFIKLHEKISENPIKNFFEAQGFVGMNLTPGQRVLFKLIMGVELDAVKGMDCFVEAVDENNEFILEFDKFTEVELFERFTTTQYNALNKDRINDISLLIGRRGSKTTCASILAVYKAIERNWKIQLGRKKVATMLIISHTKEFSDEIIEEVKAIIEESPILSRLVYAKAKNTQSTINLRVPFLNDEGKITYSYVRIRSNAASSKSSRGSACPVIICDEIAFWGSDPNAKESDTEIVRAVKPSMLQFSDDAMWIELSTPNIQAGVLYDKFEKRLELLEGQLFLKSPSWEFNNRYEPKEFAKAWKEDPINFDREYRANFSSALSGLFAPESIDRAVMKKTKIILPTDKNEKIHFASAIDAAFLGDNFAFTTVGFDEKGILTQYNIQSFKGSRQNPVSPTEVAKVLGKINRQYGLNSMTGDQFAFQPLREIFAQHDIVLEERTFSQTLKQKMYKNLKSLFDSNRIKILDDAQLIFELKQLQIEISTTGKISIHHPRGGKDDSCLHEDSLIRLKNGYKKISDIEVGDEVLTHKNRYKKVTHLSKTECSGNLKEVRSYGNIPLLITDNHPLYTNCKYYGTKKDGKYTQYKWKSLQDWKKSYKTVTPSQIPLSSDREGIYKIDCKLAKNTELPIDKEFSFLLGYFIGDGWAIRRESCKGNARYKSSICFNAFKDSNLCLKMQKYLRKIGIASHISEAANCLTLAFHSKLLWSIFTDCYNEKREKKIPGICYTHSIDFESLISGWLKADGSKSRLHKVTIGVTTSRELALELRILASIAGYHTTLRRVKRHRYEVITKDQYWLSLSKHFSEQDYCKLTFDNNFIASKILTNKAIKYDGFVYNIRVEEDNSYVANGYVVHNCDALALAAYMATEKVAMLESSFDMAITAKDYGIKIDQNTGKNINAAPTPEQLSLVYEKNIEDNVDDYEIDPKTGKLKPKVDPNDDGCGLFF